MDVSEILPEIDQIRKRRDARDTRAYSKSLLPAAKVLKIFFGKWRDEELSELKKECGLLSSVLDEDGKNYLNQIQADLESIDINKVPNARQKIDRFVRQLKSREMENRKEVFDELEENLSPAVTVVFEILRIRARLEAMEAIIAQLQKSEGSSPTIGQPSK